MPKRKVTIGISGEPESERVFEIEESKPRGRPRKIQPLKPKQLNLEAIMAGINKYIREHPILGIMYREELASYVVKNPRLFRKEQTYISR